MVSYLWQICCAKDRSIYEWRRIETPCNINVTCIHPSYNKKLATCPVQGKAGLSVSIVKEGVVIAVAKNGLWKYDYLQLSWVLLQAAESNGIFGSVLKSNVISYSVETKGWESTSAFGEQPYGFLSCSRRWQRYYSVWRNKYKLLLLKSQDTH